MVLADLGLAVEAVMEVEMEVEMEVTTPGAMVAETEIASQAGR